MREDINNLIGDLLFEEFRNKSVHMTEKLIGKQKKLDVAKPKGKLTSADFDTLRRSKNRSIKSNEFDEGNAFTGALSSARKLGKSSFKIGSKTYPVKETSSYSMTENEWIDLIEKIVLEAKNSNITERKPAGLTKTVKVLDQNKKENENYLKGVGKKFKEYLKDGSNGSYDPNPSSFPKQNGQLAKKNDRKGYHASPAVDEYVEYFAYPGQTNLNYNEIKPEDSRIERYLKGDSTTGNSPKYANAEESNVGDKFYKNYKDNVYGAEQSSASYKKEPQPIDTAGDVKQPGGLLKNRTSLAKSKKVLNQLESKDRINNSLLNEISMMSKLLKYNKKTQ